jgi:hypothetical protein
LLVDIRIATQRDSKHCFHAQVHYNLKLFTSTRPLHYFLVTCPYWNTFTSGVKHSLPFPNLSWTVEPDLLS